MSEYAVQILQSNFVPPQHFSMSSFPHSDDYDLEGIHSYSCLSNETYVTINSNWDNLDCLSNETHINYISRNWNNLDSLNAKSDELREKEKENTITEFEKCLLYDIIRNRILEFPNPYASPDYDEAIALSKKYEVIRDANTFNVSNKMKSLLSLWRR